MESLPKLFGTADLPYRIMTSDAGVSPQRSFRFARARMLKQRGVVLFFTLIALLAMSLAVVALIRSVDTNAMIAGNLAFRQVATASGDAGVEAAIGALTAMNAAGLGTSVLNNTPAVHPFNVDAPAAGYYSSLNPNLSLTDPTQPLRINWTNADSAVLATDATTGTTVRYVIQRMCRDANQPVQATPCMYGTSDVSLMAQNIQYPPDVCSGPGCPVEGQTTMYRITSRTEGLRNSVSYVQTIVY